MLDDLGQYALGCARDLMTVAARVSGEVIAAHHVLDLSLHHLARILAEHLGAGSVLPRQQRVAEGHALSTAWNTLQRFRGQTLRLRRLGMLSDDQADLLDKVADRSAYALRRLLHARGHAPITSWPKPPSG